MTKRRALYTLAHLQQTVEMEGKEEGGTYEALQQEVVWREETMVCEKMGKQDWVKTQEEGVVRIRRG
ncbi:hypothetical protein SLA2020_419960 [Shorea laevis]